MSAGMKRKPRVPGGDETRCGMILAVILLAATAATAAGEPRRISFPEAVEIALQQNVALRRAVNDTALDRMSVSQARMGFFPDLRLGLSGSQRYQNSAAEESFSAGLSSSVTLFDGLANVAGLREALLEESAGVLDMDRARETVVFQVISGYLGMIEADEQLRVREENAAAQEKQEQSVRALVEGGVRPISDLYQQQASVAGARSSLVEARRTLELSRVDLMQILQLDPAGAYVFEIPPLPAAEGEGPDPDLAALLERAFARRSDLRALAARREAAGERERAARGGYWPSLSLSANYGGSYSSTYGGSLRDQLDERRSGSVGLSLSLPLFDRWNTRYETARARINTENAELGLADLRQQVALQVRRAVLDRNAAVEGLRAAEAQVRAARQALEATEERYAVGAATLYEVTLARADFVTASSAHVRARYNLLWQERLIEYYVGDLDPARAAGKAGGNL